MDPIVQLEREWEALAAGPLAQRMRRWAEREPALAVFSTPQQMLRFLRTPRGDREAKNETLAALLRQARIDPLAGRVVLQALLPGLMNLAGRVLFEAGERDELWSLLLAHVWMQIRTYPLERRPRKIAANLLLDTLGATMNELAAERRARAELPREPLTAPAGVEELPDGGIDRLLGRAVAAGALSAEEAELILETRIDRVDLHALADKKGVAYNTLNVRRIRAERRLAVFLGRAVVISKARNRPFLIARAAGDGLTGSAGGGAAHPPDRRR